MIGAKAGGATLVSMTTVAMALSQRLPESFIAGLRHSARSVKQGEQAQAQPVRQKLALAGSRVTQMPESLPGCTMEKSEIYRPYYLPGHILRAGLLGQTAAAFFKWETDDINLTRKGPRSKTSSSSRKGMRDFLGYVRRHHPKIKLNFDVYMKGHVIAQYVAFKRARGVLFSTLSADIKRVKKIIIWRATLCKDIEADHIASLLEDVSTLVRHIGRLVPAPKSMDQHEAENKWLSEAGLVETLQRLEQRALAIAKAGNRTRKAALLVADGVLLGMSFLHLPPMRPAVLRSLQSEDDGSPCTHEIHGTPAEAERCPKNRFTRIGPHVYSMLVKHHKTEILCGYQPIGPLLINASNVTSQFCELLEHYFAWARQMVAKEGVNEFLCAPMGGAWSETNFSNRLVHLIVREMDEMGLPSKHVSYTMVR